jgi:hypothetical protein
MALKPHPSDPNHSQERKRAKDEPDTFNNDPAKRANDERLKQKS